MPQARLVLAALVAAALTACSSGSGPGWTSTYLFFGEARESSARGFGRPGARPGIIALDPVSLATATVEPAGVTTVREGVVLRVGVLNPPSSLLAPQPSRLDDVHAHALLYLRQEPASGEDRLFAVSATGAWPGARRLSTFSAAPGAFCTMQVFPDFAHWDSSVAVVATAAPDADCATTVVLTQIRLSATETSTPATYPFPAGDQILAPVLSERGAIHAWLMSRRDVAGVWVEPADWATSATTTLTTSAETLAVAAYPGKVWLEVDGALKVYAAGGTRLADPGGVPTLLSSGREWTWRQSDGRYLWFCAIRTPGAAVQRVPLDGSAPVETVHALGADSAESFLLSEDRVAYQLPDGRWKAFPKAGGDASVLLDEPGMAHARGIVVGSSFYFVDPVGLTTTAWVDPGGAKTVRATPGWTTFLVPVLGRTGRLTPTGLGADSRRILLVEADMVNGGARLTPFDGASATALGEISLPPELATTVAYPVPYPYGSGGSERTLVQVTGADGTSDLLAIDLAHPGPAQRVTPRSGSWTVACSTGGGLAAAPALAAVLALRLLRRRRE